MIRIIYKYQWGVNIKRHIRETETDSALEPTQLPI